MTTSSEDLVEELKERVTLWRKWRMERNLTLPDDVAEFEEEIEVFIQPYVRRLLEESIIEREKAEELLAHCYWELSEFRRQVLEI